jgi:short-subunit dehydrogenase
VVHPGGIATSIATSARSPESTTEAEKEEQLARARKMLRMPPGRAAEIILEGIRKDRARVLVGNDARILSWLERLMPVNYWRLLPGLFNRQD